MYEKAGFKSLQISDHCKLHKYICNGEFVSHMLALLFSTINCMFLSISMELYMAKRLMALWPLSVIYTDLMFGIRYCSLAFHVKHPTHDPLYSKYTNLLANGLSGSCHTRFQHPKGRCCIMFLVPSPLQPLLSSTSTDARTQREDPASKQSSTFMQRSLLLQKMQLNLTIYLSIMQVTDRRGSPQIQRVKQV